MIGLIDAIGWQNMVDFRTGNTIKHESDLVTAVSKIIRDHRYPGEIKKESDNWVTDVALELNQLYSPDFIMLDYAQPHFKGVYSEENDESFIKNSFKQIEKFLNETDFDPLILGLRDLTDIKGLINTEKLVMHGFSTSAINYAQIYTSKKLNKKKFMNVEGIKKIMSKEDILNSMEGSEDFKDRLGDYVLEAKDGYYFKAIGGHARKTYRVGKKDKHIPVYTTLEYPEDITDIAGIIKRNIEKTKIALILVENAGFRNFPYPYKKCKNYFRDFIYTTPRQQYLAITSGLHFNQFGYPFACKLWEKKEYLYTPYYMDIPENTIGRVIKKKSIAVGNRSIFTHATSGADISIEPYSRELIENGILATFNLEKMDNRNI